MERSALRAISSQTFSLLSTASAGSALRLRRRPAQAIVRRGAAPGRVGVRSIPFPPRGTRRRPLAYSCYLFASAPQSIDGFTIWNAEAQKLPGSRSNCVIAPEHAARVLVGIRQSPPPRTADFSAPGSRRGSMWRGWLGRRRPDVAAGKSYPAMYRAAPPEPFGQPPPPWRVASLRAICAPMHTGPILCLDSDERRQRAGAAAGRAGPVQGLDRREAEQHRLHGTRRRSIVMALAGTWVTWRLQRPATFISRISHPSQPLCVRPKLQVAPSR